MPILVHFSSLIPKMSVFTLAIFWPAARTGALAVADLGGVVCESYHRATEQTTHKLENSYTKEVLALLENF